MRRADGIAWVPFFPLGSALRPAAQGHRPPGGLAQRPRLGVTPAQVGLAWLLAHAPDTLLIPGTRELAHLADNVAAADVPVDAAALSLRVDR